MRRGESSWARLPGAIFDHPLTADGNGIWTVTNGTDQSCCRHAQLRRNERTHSANSAPMWSYTGLYQLPQPRRRYRRKHIRFRKPRRRVGRKKTSLQTYGRPLWRELFCTSFFFSKILSFIFSQNTFSDVRQQTFSKLLHMMRISPAQALACRFPQGAPQTPNFANFRANCNISGTVIPQSEVI